MFFNKSFVFAILFATSALSAPVFGRADDAAASSKALAGAADIAPALNSTVSQSAAGNSTATGQGAKGGKNGKQGKGKKGKGKGKGKKSNEQQATVTKTITAVTELTVTVTVTDKNAVGTAAAAAAGVNSAAAAQITGRISPNATVAAFESSLAAAKATQAVPAFSVPGSAVSVTKAAEAEATAAAGADDEIDDTVGSGEASTADEGVVDDGEDSLF